MFFIAFFLLYLLLKPPNEFIMHNRNQFTSFKEHLIKRYNELIEKSNDYRFEDEVTSDIAAFKAMKLLEKINQFSFLDRKSTV